MNLKGYVVMMVVLITFLTIIGIDTGVSSYLSYFGMGVEDGNITTGFESSSFWAQLFGVGIGILTLLGITGSVLIGFFGKGYDPSLILVPFIIGVGGACISSFGAIIVYINSIQGISWWVTSIVSLIFGALFIGFVFSCADYFAGR